MLAQPIREGLAEPAFEKALEAEPERWEDVSMRVLFVCTRNACRSQMAEALARALGGSRLEAASAGSDPGEIDPLTLEVLKEAGIGTDGLRAKGLTEVDAEAHDWVVTLCDEAQASCPSLSGRRGRHHWPVEDPAAVAEGGPVRLQAFRDARDAIRARIERWLAEQERSE
ncbi:MAG: arsenate reductase ArsC [Acidobacteria bacterium]|nr:arsenate reductase ArsC [Acidobacteriota bacterium]